MCGICGKLNRHPENPVDPKLIEKMCDVITHRGPDDAGYYVENNVGLGMRRLSIIDLSGGHQPIYNEDKSVVVVLNGEIYNFPELRERLSQQGHVFQSHSDTEVIVHLYEEVGEDCVKELRGMFGFALYDLKKRKLMVARDRMGIKPIYYALDHDKLLFGSELKSLIQDRTLKRDLDYFSLNCYFSFMNTVAPDSIFQSVKRLMPGQYIVYEKDRLRVEDYWNFELSHSRAAISEEDAVQELLEKLVEINDPIKIGLYLPLIAQRLTMNEEMLVEQFRRLQKRRQRMRQQQENRRQETPIAADDNSPAINVQQGQYQAEAGIIYLLLNGGQAVRNYLMQNLSYNLFDNPKFIRLYEAIINELEETGSVEEATILNMFQDDPEVQAILSELALKEFNDLEKLARDCIFQLKRWHLEKEAEELKKKEKVQLVGLGTFQPVKRKARMGVNPKTGEKIQIPAMTVPKFKPGKGLKEAVR